MTNKLNIFAAAGVCLLGLAAAPARFALAADQQPHTEPQAAWSTPGDGRLVMLARYGKEFADGMPFRTRVCVTNFTGANNSVNLFVWTTPGLQPNATASAQPQTRQLQLGDCIEIDQPAAIIVQDATTSGTSSGYYQLLEPTSLPNGVTTALDPIDAGTPHVQRHDDEAITIGVSTPQSVKCFNLPTPTPDFYRSCPVSLPKITTPDETYVGVRLCIGDHFVTLSDKTNIDYAASLLELIVDKTLQNKPKLGSYDYHWNPVTPLGCRDLIGAGDDAVFMVGPKEPGGYWNPANVDSIHITLQSITVRKTPSK